MKIRSNGSGYTAVGLAKAVQRRHTQNDVIRPFAKANLQDSHAVRLAYGRLARIYDPLFDYVFRRARNLAAASVNILPGCQVLEAGVGTGLALPLYSKAKKITGIDVSFEMLVKARHRVELLHLDNIEALLEMDAQKTIFPDDQFDIAVAMFVASVAPDPRALLAELRRVVKTGGTILFVNHFASKAGPRRYIENTLSSMTAKWGWHADFKLSDIFDHADLAAAAILPVGPYGLFQMVELKN